MFVCLFCHPGGKQSTYQCKRCKGRGCTPWVRKIPWKRIRQPTPVYVLGRFHRLRSLEGYGPWGHKESDMTEHAHIVNLQCCVSFRYTAKWFSYTNALSILFQILFPYRLLQNTQISWLNSLLINQRKRLFMREGTYVFLWLIHIDVWQITTKFCKATILWLKNKYI